VFFSVSYGNTKAEVNAMKLNAIKALMKKRVSKIILAVVLCGVVAFLLISFLKPGSAPAAQYQTAIVGAGNLTVEISGSGNLALSSTEDVAFELAGTVQEVLVEEGDSVEEGQVLARLDTSERESELTGLERALLQAKINLKNARLALERAEEDDNADPLDIDMKELQVTLAEGSLEDAEEALEEASNASPEVIAPFNGFITNVNVRGGDEVKKGTVAATIADPDKFEVDILVSEMDISEVEKGGRATVQADAISGITFPAEVTYIAPTATIQSGVVNYQVTVEVGSLSDIAQVLPSGMTPPEGFTPPVGWGNSSISQAVGTFEAIQLRDGLTVTVNIIVDQRINVLVVPNGAITTQGGRSYVEVLSTDGTIETRAIRIGITDYVNTEVTDGLNEGEKVIVPQGTTTTTQQQGGGGIFPGGGTFPGGGIFRSGAGG
jgi:macrolide-specific efflux system membrane fusion protein